MGQISARVVISNAFDVQKLRHHEIEPTDLRTLTVEDAMVDTGAPTLCLPQAIIELLGLEPAREVRLAIATGYVTWTVYEGARVECEGRSSIVEALALPGGHRVLLGAIPMEIMGLEPDLKNGCLRVLPDQGNDTYLTAMSFQ
jgi:predicted aspartyl protease